MNQMTQPADRSGAIADFDLASIDQAFLDDPFPTYARLREESPVHRNRDGSYFVTRYEHVAFVLHDRAMSSDKTEIMAKQFGEKSPIYEHNTHTMVFRDPPDHTRIRKLIAHAFTPRAMKMWEPRVESAVRLLLDRVQGRRMDLISEFSYMLPLTVIAEMMGVPTEENLRFKDWSAGVTASLEPRTPSEIVAEGNRVVEEFKAYLGELAERRRREPGDDLMSLLVAAEQDGDTLTELDLVHNAAFLLNAGHETTSNLIGSGMHALFNNPDQYDLIRRRPELAASAVEEMLRFDSPNQIGGRLATEPVTIGGEAIPGNTFVWISNGAANRDPAAFDAPERFDIERTPNKHVAFGHGIHVCLGAALARLEATVALRTLVTDYPDLRPDGAPVRRPRARHRGFSSYPVAF